MGLPSGVFSHARAGRLEVSFQGRWLVDGSEFAGVGVPELLLRAYVEMGSLRRTQVMTIIRNSAQIEIDYPGGGVEVNVGIEDVDHYFDAAEELAAERLKITCRLHRSSGAAVVSLDAVLANLRAQLRPMSDTPQTPRWEPDTEGTHWHVGSLADLATVEVSLEGFTGELGGAAFDDASGRRIDPASIVAYSTPLASSTPEQPMSSKVVGGSHVDLKGGIPLGRWYATYRCVGTAGDGTSEADAWPGFDAIDDELIEPGDTLNVYGTHQDTTLAPQFGGTAGAYVKIKLHANPSNPGNIYQGRVVQDPEWVDAGGGEWYVEEALAPNNMVFENGVRLRGMGITSRATCNVLNYDLGADTLLISSLRPVVTGTQIFITANINLARIPAPLVRQTPYYVILVSGPAWSLSLQLKQYTVKLAATAEDAAAGIAIDLTTAGDGGSWYVWHANTDWPFLDPVPGSLGPGQYGYDAQNARLYYRPTTGTPADHEVRWSRDQGAFEGACIYIDGYSYIKILGGGDYGGLFGDEPVGSCSYAHLIPIVVRNATDVLVDGVLMRGCRHGVGHREAARLTVRNCWVDDSGWHALGSDQVTQVTGCPDLVIERNRCTRIGLAHDWGDVQGIITTPKCHRAIIRRNYIETCARNEVIINTGTIVVDSSDDVVVYLNWSHDFSGVGIVTAPGPDGPIPGMVLGANIFTLGSNPARLGDYPEGPVHGRVGAFAMVNQNTDVNSVTGGQAFGNIVAYCSVPYTAEYAPTEHLGHVHIRTSALATVEVDFTRNAFLECSGLIYAITRFNVGTGTPFGTLTGDSNLYAGLSGSFYERWSQTTQVEAFDSLHVLGPAPDNWSGSSGNDLHSKVRASAVGTFVAPTMEQLEILRLYDEFDTLEKPTQAIVGNFPWMPGL